MNGAQRLQASSLTVKREGEADILELATDDWVEPEIVRDRAEIADLLVDYERSCRSSVDILVQGARPLATGAAAEQRVLERGIPVRCIYESALAGTVEGRRYLEAWHERGERQRVIDSVPVRAAVIDRTVVLAPIASEQGAITSLLVVRAGLGAAMAQLFDLLWVTEARRSAPPLERPLTPQEIQILTLMCDGATDQGIARALDIGRRTVQRRVQELSGLLGAPSRAALAARAVAYGFVRPFSGRASG